ncbi:MAG: hypothetical protein JXR97_00350 [Planctomycetes bacterium]|nr:hypothetical protein [Planctomycetota bacterium]
MLDRPETSTRVKAKGGTASRAKNAFLGINHHSALFSVLLATIIWIYVDSRRMVEQTFDVRIDLDVPAGWELEGNIPQDVTISVRGARQIMSTLNADEIRLTKTIEVPEVPEKVFEIKFEERDIKGIPPQVSVNIIKPNSINASLVQLVSKYLAVKVETVGQPEKGYSVALTQSEPWYVEVKAPKELITDQDFIRTEPIDLSGRSVGFAEWVYLQPFRKKDKTIKVDRQVYASVELIEKPSRRTFNEKIPVRVLIAPGEDYREVQIKPAAVTVTVEGVIDNVSTMKASELVIYVDSHDKVPAGKNKFQVKCSSLPLKKARVVQISPDQVEWIVVADQPEVEKKKAAENATTKQLEKK